MLSPFLSYAPAHASIIFAVMISMNPSIRQLAIAIAAVTAAAAFTGAAFAGWMNHGADILVTMAASGLAWCL